MDDQTSRGEWLVFRSPILVARLKQAFLRGHQSEAWLRGFTLDAASTEASEFNGTEHHKGAMAKSCLEPKCYPELPHGLNTESADIQKATETQF